MSRWFTNSSSAPIRLNTEVAPPGATSSCTRRSLLSAGFALFAGASLTALSSVSAQQPLPLVLSPAQARDLQEQARDEVVFLDSREIRMFRQERLPSARFGWWQDTIDPNYPWYGAVLTQGEDQAFRQALIGELGINSSYPVVVYDNTNGYRAARWVWFLRFLGFQAALLDGGFASWKAAGFETESGTATPVTPTNPPVNPLDGYYLVTRQLIDRIATPAVVIIDTRTSEERTSKSRDIPRIGALPGSISIPWTAMLDSGQNTLASANTLSQLITQHDLANAMEIIVYAQYGVDAALPWLVLTSAGLTQATIYDRGWVEWSNREDLPVEPLS